MVAYKANTNETLPNNDEGFDWREVGKLLRKNDLTLTNGICLPVSCSPEKVIDYANTILERADLVALNAICRTNDPIKFKAIDIFTM